MQLDSLQIQKILPHRYPFLLVDRITGAAFITSILLSLFLARTIVRPLRSLVRAAVRVRLGRDREVVVPRLPERRDEWRPRSRRQEPEAHHRRVEKIHVVDAGHEPRRRQARPAPGARAPPVAGGLGDRPAGPRTAIRLR